MSERTNPQMRCVRVCVYSCGLITRRIKLLQIPNDRIDNFQTVRHFRMETVGKRCPTFIRNSQCLFTYLPPEWINCSKYTFRPQWKLLAHFICAPDFHIVFERCRKTMLIMPSEKGNDANASKCLHTYATPSQWANECAERRCGLLRDSNLIFKPLNSRFVNYILVLKACKWKSSLSTPVITSIETHRTMGDIVHPIPDEKPLAALHIISYICVSMYLHLKRWRIVPPYSWMHGRVM